MGDPLTSILTYHVASGSVMSADLSDGMEVPTLQGEMVTITTTDGVKVNDATVVIADVETDNGVIHVIDAVIVPPSIDVAAFLETCPDIESELVESVEVVETDLVDIPTTAEIAGEFNTLLAAVTAAGLASTLAGNGPFTVFAPNDAAFAALPEGLVECLLNDIPSLKNILLYHVANGNVLSSDLTDGMEVTTLLGGENLIVSLGDGVKINESTTVIAPDVLASNGVIHVIDQVLVPGSIDVAAYLATCKEDSEDIMVITTTCSYLGVSRNPGEYLTGPTHTCLCTESGHWTNCRLNDEDKKTIEQVVTDSDQLSTLEAAIGVAGISGVLDGPGPYTLFAPTDRAFQNVPSELLTYLLDNPTTLAQVLQYHVLDGEVPSSAIALGTGAVSTLLEGEDTIDVEKVCWTAVETCDSAFSITLNDSSYVVAADVSTANGIIHIIEEVLIPPSLADAVEGIIAA